MARVNPGELILFQFTHPGRGATLPAALAPVKLAFQFTHPGRGATDERFDDEVKQCVSIHAPREGCDMLEDAHVATLRRFQFTHPGRGATSSLS